MYHQESAIKKNVWMSIQKNDYSFFQRFVKICKNTSTSTSPLVQKIGSFADLVELN